MSKDLQGLWKNLQSAVETMNTAKTADDAAKAEAEKTGAVYSQTREAVAQIRADLQATMDELLPPASDRVRIS